MLNAKTMIKKPERNLFMRQTLSKDVLIIIVTRKIYSDQCHIHFNLSLIIMNQQPFCKSSTRYAKQMINIWMTA